jgi:hypothetical protein
MSKEELYSRYRVSLRGILRAKKKIKRQVENNLDDLDFCSYRNYRIELLNVIASNLRLLLSEVDGRYTNKQQKLNPVFYRWDM